MSSRNAAKRPTHPKALKPPKRAPYPAAPDGARFSATMKVPHDLGGEAGGSIPLEEGKKEQWELNTYATCEVLGWRGVWNTVEKHRRHADLGEAQYLALPYYGRWLLSAARVMVDKEHITLTELMDRVEEVKRRHEQKSPR